jgi:hypothetical protein
LTKEAVNTREELRINPFKPEEVNKIQPKLKEMSIKFAKDNPSGAVQEEALDEML